MVVIATAQLHSTKPELRFCSNHPRGVSKICDGENSQENVCVGIPFLVFCCELWEICKNTVFAEHHRTTASNYSVSIVAKGVYISLHGNSKCFVY